MEDSKLQRLHETLSKLRPTGNHGLGRAYSSGGISAHKHRDNGLPKNGEWLLW
jgi:hypothetical protein